MQLTQTYARPSAAATREDGGLGFSLAGEAHRPPVSLRAIVRDSRDYARTMLALHNVVSSDLRFQAKDHTAYQEWVTQKYWEEAGPQIQVLQDQFERDKENRGRLEGELKTLLAQRAEIEKDCKPIIERLIKIEAYAWWESNFWQMRRDLYTPIVQKFGKDALWALRPCDPVVSVHPDATIFEVFSFDESSYGRVTVPTEKLEVLGEAQYGTTNVDFSLRLAEEFARVRSYRPAWIEVEPAGVTLATSAGAQIEKKIDLPPSWVRGFLQVQSAVSLPSIEVRLSPSTVAEILLKLHQQRESKGPRSLKFHLAPNQKPRVEIEPWGVEIQEPDFVWSGAEAQEIRIWGRRRLFVFENLLPFASHVAVRLLGTGMPSYWSIENNGHRFDLGLSGWTENDWSSAARFDLLSATKEVSEGDVELAATQLENALKLSPESLASRSDLSREASTSALQKLCKQGRAMFDPVTHEYRWRQLLAFPAPEGEADKKLESARRAIAEGNAQIKEISPGEDDEFLARWIEKGARLFAGKVKTIGGKFEPTIGLDADGRAVFAQCTCAEFRNNKLRKGPCAHILASTALAGQKLSEARPVGTSAPKFKDQVWVFTGALSKFTREQAEAFVQQNGGTTAGSVSKTTTHLVAGERAGSKLKKAIELGIPVLSEDEFLQRLNG